MNRGGGRVIGERVGDKYLTGQQTVNITDSLHAGIEENWSDFHELSERYWTEVGGEESGTQPVGEHVQIR